MNNDGYIKLFRRLLDWEWYDHPPTKDVFIHCLLSASHKETIWHGYQIMPGEFISSVNKISTKCGLTTRQTRTALEHLEMSGEVTMSTTSKFTLFKVNNWSEFQSSDKQNDKPTTSQRQAERQTVVAKSDKLPTTIKNVKKQEERSKEITKENNNQKEQRKRFSPKARIDEYTNDESLKQALLDFVEMRKQMKKPLTQRALEMCLKKLDELAIDDFTKREIVDQAIMKGWQSFYPLSGNRNNNDQSGLAF